MEKGILLNLKKLDNNYTIITFGLLKNDNSLKGYEIIDLFLEKNDLFENINSSDILKEINMKIIYEDIYYTYSKKTIIKDIPEFEINGHIYHLLGLNLKEVK